MPQNKTNQSKKTAAPKIRDVKEFTELYQSIATLFGECEPNFIEAKNLIENTCGIKKPTKKMLTSKIETVFRDLNFIVDKIGKMGKVK